MVDTYQEILQYVSDFGQTDMAGMDTEELEELLEEITDMADDMEGLKDTMQELIDAVLEYEEE